MKKLLTRFLSISLLISTGTALTDSCFDSCAPCEPCSPVPCTSAPVCGVGCATVCSFDNRCDKVFTCCGDDDTYYNKTHFSPRPQGSNAARRVLGMGTRSHTFGNSEFYSNASVAFEYQQSFNRHDNCSNKLGIWLSPNCSNCIMFGPDSNHPTLANNPTLPLATGVTDVVKSCVDVRGLDLGLAPNHKSRICINPKIKNVIADFDFWFGLDGCMSGLWARLDVPLVWTQWEVESYEREVYAGSPAYTSPVVCPAGAQTPVVYNKQREAWCGDKPFGAVPELQYGKLCCGKNDAFNAAGIRFDLGYDIWRSKCGHFGIGGVVVAGVGTKTRAETIFQPSIGANQAWQIGFTFNGSLEIYNRNDTQSLTLLADATVTHLLKHTQQRLFGLKANGAWSQYLLLKKFVPSANGVGYTFDGFEHAANILAGTVKIKNDIMVDAAWAFSYRHCNLSVTLGTNIWYRSADRIADGCNFGIAENRYGIKGLTECDEKTASLSTINTSLGTNLNNNNTYTAPLIPDGRTVVPVGVPLNVDDGYVVTSPVGAPAVTYGPNTVTLTNSNIDICCALHPKSFSGKIFGSLEYSWQDNEWQPFVLVGAEAEFSRGNTAADQIGLILKGGISY